jgi:hypothetical protein
MRAIRTTHLLCLAPFGVQQTIVRQGDRIHPAAVGGIQVRAAALDDAPGAVPQRHRQRLFRHFAPVVQFRVLVPEAALHHVVGVAHGAGVYRNGTTTGWTTPRTRP